MSKVFKQIVLVLGLVFALQDAWSFSLMGTREDYQVAALGYEPPRFGFGISWRNQVKNIDDEFRWNTKVVYYSYDPEFISYFGSNGIVAIDEAFAMINSLTNVSEYSPNLTEFPLESTSVNFTAQALELYDLKSSMFENIVGRYGLTDPEHFVWTLRNRALPPGAQCPDFVYSVIKRNFDPLTWEPSSYVNGNLFTYVITELCPAPINIQEASAQEVLVDPLGRPGFAVAGWGAGRGEFYRGLTRDDIGGIRYLLSSNNVNWETTPPNSFVPVTNSSQVVLVFPSDLQTFAEDAVTNDAAALEALYPGLDVTSTSNFFVNVVTTNVTAEFVVSPYLPPGSPPELVLGTTLTTNVETHFVHTFGNILTNQFSTNCRFSLLTTNIAPSPYAPPDSGISITNVTVEDFIESNCLSGSFIILPTNVCDYQILSTQFTEVIITTNFLTNTFTSLTLTNESSTNGGTATFEFSQSILSYFTNEILVAYPVTCPDDITSLFEGAEKIKFVRRDFDSLLGQFFEPVTTNFTLTEITNSARLTRIVERTIASPDILISAGDQTSGGTTLPAFPVNTITAPSFQTASNANVLGPGTITPSVQYTFNKVGPFVLNSGPSLLTELDNFSLGFRWGSFDGSTNAPIVYPVGTDLMALENLVLINLAQPSVITNGAYLLPDGAVGVPYNGGGGYQFEVTGGTPPYVWDTTVTLPDGMTNTAGGLLFGTPTTAGIYDFTIRMTDAAARFVDFPFTLTVQP